MSNADLMEILNLFPEDKLEDMIITALRELFYLDQWGLAKMIAEQILSKIKGRDSLIAKTTNLCVQMAVKAKNPDLAFHYYNSLCEMATTDENLFLRARGLFYMTDLFLPAHPTKLAQLWQAGFYENLPPGAQEIYADIGVMLCKQFVKNRDRQQCQSIAETMKQKLAARIYSARQSCLNKLLKLER